MRVEVQREERIRLRADDDTIDRNKGDQRGRQWQRGEKKVNLSLKN